VDAVGDTAADHGTDAGRQVARGAPVRWTVLVPVRALPGAKSRLAATLPITMPGALHADVVAAIRADTLASVHAVAAVSRVVTVADRPGDGVSLVQSSPGLNGALRDAAAFAAARWPDDGVAALVGDLPALQPADLGAALAAAAQYAAAFVPDRSGTGTTLLTAAPGTPLAPRFGAGSAVRHAAVAVRLAAGPGLRHDVDTAADLADAARLELGPHTAAVLHAVGIRSP
jgi:2-phospho-L-lactate/phosphoenolpyruvate guanylyltransferase